MNGCAPALTLIQIKLKGNLEMGYYCLLNVYRYCFIAPVDNYKYDKYATSRQFLIAVTKAIGTVANVSLVRVNGIQVSALDCVAN